MYLLDDVDNILTIFKADLKAALGDKIEDLILFGSYSRGNYTQYSDIDLLILVKGNLMKDETQFIDNLIVRYSLEYGVVISGLVYPAEIYHQFNTPFLLNVKEEGISI
ncbi:MAG: nucleotidyltransferase domain-containing protein [Methanotrichaceae archaeon]